jgi:hypothetical protein
VDKTGLIIRFSDVRLGKVPRHSPVHQQEGRRETLTPPGVIVAMKAASILGSILRATLLGGVSAIPKSVCPVFQS